MTKLIYFSDIVKIRSINIITIVRSESDTNYYTLYLHTCKCSTAISFWHLQKNCKLIISIFETNNAPQAVITKQGLTYQGTISEAPVSAYYHTIQLDEATATIYPNLFHALNEHNEDLAESMMDEFDMLTQSAEEDYSFMKECFSDFQAVIY